MYTIQSLWSHVQSYRPSHVGILVAMVGLAVGLAGCDGSSVTGANSSDDAAPVSLSFDAEAGGSSAKTMKAQRTITDSSGNALRLDQVEIILREIEFDRADGAENCSPGAVPDADDGCEEVESGPLLVSLPLGSDSPTVVIDTTLPVGQWKEAEFEVHELDPEVPSDSALLQEHDFPADVSIRAQGEYTPVDGSAEAFTFTSDLSAEREIEFEPPVEVTAEGMTNITFSVDVGTWFRQDDGTLLDPSRALEDGPFDDVVEENIETSIEGFEDDDRDGEREDDEDGEEDEDEGDDDDDGDENDGDDEENEDDGDEDDGDEDDGDEDETEVEIEEALTNTGPDPDASGEAEFEQETGKTEFKVEAEDLDSGTYEVVVADTTRGELDVGSSDDDTEGKIEFKDPSDAGHPLLDFDPRGKKISVSQEGTVYLEVDFPSSGSE